jgi:hypothetical protein
MDSKEMMKGTKILHCKFMAKRLSYIGEEVGEDAVRIMSSTYRRR